VEPTSSMGAATAGERLRAVALVVAAMSVLGFLYLFNPSTSTLYPTCPFSGSLVATVRDAGACARYTS
jgi:hypothetical protein